MSESYKRVGHFRTVTDFQEHLRAKNIRVPIDTDLLSAAQGSSLAQAFTIGKRVIGNRWCIHPMEGWDTRPDGIPSVHTIRRWERFGLSGAKLIWGGEAFAVQFDGRANPNQLFYSRENVQPMRDLLESMRRAHEQRLGPGSSQDWYVGLQLTHSGRFSRPQDKKKLQPRIAYHHPLLDPRCGVDPANHAVILTDDDIKRLIDAYIVSAQMAQAVGFHFVDVKACHGYLGHEFLSAFERPGPFGGDLHGRTNFMRQIIQGIQAQCPGLDIGVRLSAFDSFAHHADPHASTGDKLGPGIPDHYDFAKFGPYPGFGCNRANPLQIDLTETIALLKMMRDEFKIQMVNLSAGSPYYNPHLQRPAMFPPSDGYQPPEDPLVGCARQMDVVRQLKAAVPGLPLVGTAYTYFQEYLPHVAQAAVRENWVDFVGIGRMVLSYPEMCVDVLEAGKLRTPKLICRTFSDCTTAPRNGIISGCYPLDDHYKSAAEAEELKTAKSALKERLKVLHGAPKPH